MSKLNGKIAVITGGSSGIGLAAAKKFVEEGAYVFIVGRRQSELDKAKAEIGRNVTAVQADVANLDDLDRLYGRVKEEKGAVDIVVASAAFVERVSDARMRRPPISTRRSASTRAASISPCRKRCR